MDAMTLAARIAALADELEASPGYGGRYDANVDCAERLREILAEVNQATVWTVANHDYDDTSTIAIFTSQELADQHAADRDGGYEVIEHDILDHRPAYLSVEHRSACVFPDGTIEARPRYRREEWDYLLGERVSIRRWEDRSTDVAVWDEHGRAPELLHAQVTAILAEYGDSECAWTPEKLAATLARPGSRYGTRPEQNCYDASFGRVHARSSCRCPR